MIEEAVVDGGTFTIAAEHPALPGHFPGNPIVPGVVLLDRATAIILAAHPGRWLAGLPMVKFLRPVRSGESVRVRYAPTPPRIAFTCCVGDVEAVRGTLLLDAVK